MRLRIRHIGAALLLALLALALLPPGPSRPQLALAQGDDGTTTIYLPLVSGGGASPDLVFDPAELVLGPGEASTTILTVNPAADLRGASFTLTDGPTSLTTSFEAAADGSSGTLIIAASADAAERDQTFAVLGRSGTSDKAWAGTLSVSTTKARIFFIDPVKGKDTNSGSQSKPFRTLFKALSKATAGDTVILGKGVYSETANGEQYTTGSAVVLVPSGVRRQLRSEDNSDVSRPAHSFSEQGGDMIRGQRVTLRHVEARELDELIRRMNDMQLRGWFVRAALASPQRLRQEYADNAMASETSERLVIAAEDDRTIRCL